jgi:xanthine/uracil/vitamin C permease (AzgA family)
MQTAYAFVAGLVILVALVACSQAAPRVETGPVATSAIQGATPAASVEARLNPTEAVGGGSLSSNAIPADDVAKVFATVSQASQLKFSANSSPPGATGADVATVSVIAQDSGGLLKGMDATAKQSLGDAILTAAGTAWPNASVSLLVSSAAGGTIIGQRPKGGPNTVIAS